MDYNNHWTPALRIAGVVRQRGLTLVELMIALTLGLLLLIGIGAVFVYTGRANRQNEALSGMQDQGRFALAALTRDLSLAGYWGGLYGSSGITPNRLDADPSNDDSSATAALPASSDCGANAADSWAFQFSHRLEFRNHDDGTAVSGRWRCIGNVQAGSDIVALRRVAGRATGTMASGATSVTLRPHHYYLKTNGVIGSLVRWGAAATGSPNADYPEPPLSPPLTFYKFVPRIYFVRNYSRAAGDGLPTLCRKELCPSRYAGGDGRETASCEGASASAASTGFYSECIAEGVEDLQIVWGLDTDGDGTVERYTSTPDQNQLSLQARTAQVSLLLRSREPAPQASPDAKTYTLGDKAAYTPSGSAARYYRRIYSTTVLLHNQVN